MLKGESIAPSFLGILEGISKGDVYYNKEKALAVVYSYCIGGCGIFGNADNVEEQQIFIENVFAGMKEKGIEEFEFSTEDIQLEKELNNCFKTETYMKIGNVPIECRICLKA